MRAKTVVGMVLVLLSGTAMAGGPRFVGKGANSGQALAWSGPVVRYYTDPGNLSATVSHAQADAVVAAAAAVWNVPTASAVLSQGGTLSEHVNGSNTYFDGTGVVFPADVQAVNAAAKPIAVIYDSDGSVTDLLLGNGASDPTSCRQNEVTESVDGLGATTIQHALLVINGRCVGASTDQLNQLKYMVMRKFGRVLGLAWSQVNDAVFTGAVLTTAVMMANWPVMHPMDVVCGSFTYLCMQNPFSLRVDDLSALAGLYPVTAANVTTGKVLSSAGSQEVRGAILFPGPGLGMDQVNVVLRIRNEPGAPALTWQVASGISGSLHVGEQGNPVAGLVDTSQAGPWADGYLLAGYFDVKRVPLTQQQTMIQVDVEPINPLYTGMYALNPSGGATTAMSGTPVSTAFYADWGSGVVGDRISVPTASSACWSSLNGAESQPTVVDGSGWWAGLLCSWNAPTWGSVTIRAGRTWTLEALATDESGGQTALKAQTVLGVWHAGDAVGTRPTVASMAVPLNGRVTGLTQLAVPAAAADASYRFTVAELHGRGRPDFTFTGRVLYADAVSPAVTLVGGGQILITGMGFAKGNRVLVNGVVATVQSWSATQIVATAPTMAVAKAKAGVPVDVAVVDLTTGGVTTMSGALSYPGGGAYGVVMVSAPSALTTGATAATAFAVRVVAADGVTAIPGASVRFAVTGGSAGLLGCGVAAACVLTTNASGVAQTLVAGVAAGSVVLAATEVTGGASVQVYVVDADPVRSAVISTAAAYVAAGAAVTVPLVLHAVQDGSAASGVAVNWGVSAGLGLSGVGTVTAGDGSAGGIVATGGVSGTVRGCVWSTVCADWSVVAVGASQWTPAVVSGAGQSVAYTAALAPLVVQVTDGAGHALVGATVNVAQTVTAWQGGCPARGRCAAAAVLAAGTFVAVTDGSGLVTVVPLQVAGVPQVVNVAVSTGTSGFVGVGLVKGP